jgi:hypothetical protein
MKIQFRLLLLVSVSLLAFGCGRKPPSSEETGPFEPAIAEYLQQQGMGMKVGEFKTLGVTGDTATATVAMQDAEGLYKMNVTWEFSFQKQANEWRTVSHQTSR